MDLPEFLLEEVFAYLGWSDRARAARVSHKWLSVFHTPSLWRRMVFTPPTRSLTRLQYDMKGYYMSCCLRKIGWYVREYRFIASEDIFLLNRTLSLVAKFLEANPPISSIAEEPSRQPNYSTSLGGSLDEPQHSPESSDSFGSNEEASADQDSRNFMEDDDGDVQDAPDAEEQRMSSYSGLITGDPDAEATLKLILRLQEREMFGLDSEDSTDESDEEFIAALHRQSVAMSVSVPGPTRFFQSPGSGKSKTSRLQRSQSCRYPAYQRVTRRPPMVRTFVLDFHCEVDETRGFVYGTGGALLTTIRRVLRQLTHLQRLRLTDLFLTPSDARNLLLDITKACSTSLHILNLVHLYKPWMDLTDLVPVASNLVQHRASGRYISSDYGLDDDWYFLDSRWLGARPKRLHHNPMADLANLFPNLFRLSLGVTQLTGSMLLRLLYQTRLSELRIVQTDFTPFTLVPLSGPREEQLPFQGGSSRVSIDITNEEFSLSSSIGSHPRDELDDDLIDWGEDVPRYRDNIGLVGQVLSSSVWEPIRPTAWTAALILRPHLHVQWHCLFTRDRFDHLARVDQLLTLWPSSPAPIRVAVFRTTHGIQFSAAYLSLKNPVTLTNYSSTLTTLVLWIDAESNSRDTDIKMDAFERERDMLNESLSDILASCSLLSFVAFGGHCPYLSLITLLIMCRQRARRQSFNDNKPGPNRLTLLVQRDCCQMHDLNSSHIPATIQVWYSTILDAGNESSRRTIAAEHCISAALSQSHWHFLSSGEFKSQVSYFFE